MFGPKVAKAGTKAAENPGAALTPPAVDASGALWAGGRRSR